MKPALTRCIVIAAVCLAAGLMVTGNGCGLTRTPRPSPRSYLLDYPAPQAVQKPALPVVIRVERFSAAPELSGVQMLYRDAPYASTAYSLYRWRAAPADMASFFLARDMNASGLFTAALPYDTRLAATHSLEGRVE